MTMQRLCHRPAAAMLIITFGVCSTGFAADPNPANDYPTIARVEYVEQCIAAHGDTLASMYQCACVIDHIANKMAYDEFVEAGTFSKYSGLPGEGGAVFRDSDRARTMAKLYRDTEKEASRECGLEH